MATNKVKAKRVNAAGAVIRNDKSKVLIIERRGKWDLPKGKLNLGENYVDAVQREIKEEVGLSVIPIKEIINEIRCYEDEGCFITKNIYWFECILQGEGQQIALQEEEGITDFAWIDRHDLLKGDIDIWPNLKEIIWFSGAFFK